MWISLAAHLVFGLRESFASQSRRTMSKKLEIHQSMIHLFEKCGMAFQFRYLEGLKSPPSAALTVGRSVDDGITHNLSQKIETGLDLPLDAVETATSTAFDREAPETDWQDEDQGKAKDVAIQLVRAHHKDIAPQINPAAVQKEMRVELSEFSVAGTADIVEKDGMLCDSKTAKSAYAPNQVELDLQPAIYSYLHAKTTGSQAKGFRYDVLIKPTKTIPVRTQQVSGTVSWNQMENALKRADVLNKAVKAGVFHYAPDKSWYCSKEWCGFWKFCDRGGKK